MTVESDPALRQILLGFIRNQTFIVQLLLDQGLVAIEDVEAQLTELIKEDRRSGATPDELFATEALLDMVHRLNRPPLAS